MKQTLHSSQDTTWRAVWSHRDIRLVIPARALSFLGDTVAVAVLMLDAAVAGSPERVTGLLLAFAAPLLVLAGPAGRLVDTRDSRTLLVAAGGLQVLASAGLVWSPSYAAQLGFVVLLQCGQAVTGPTWTALLPRMVGEAAVGTAIAMSQTLGAVASLVGFAVGGVLFDRIGPHWTMGIDTLSFAVLVVVALVVRTRRAVGTETADAGSPTTERPARSGGWRSVLDDPVLALFVLALSVLVLTAEASNVPEPILVIEQLGADGTAYGLIGVCVAAGSIVGPALGGRIRSGPGRFTATATSILVIGVALVSMGRVGSIEALAPICFVLGVAVGMVNALVATVLMTRTTDDVRGRVMSLLTGATRGASMLGLLVGGGLVTAFGARTAYLVLGLGTVAAAPLALLARGAARRQQVASPAVLSDGR